MSPSRSRYAGARLANLSPLLRRRTNVVLLALLLVAGVPGAAAAAPFGNALRLDGIDDYANIADNVALDLGDADGEDFTIEAFVFVPNGSSNTNDVIFYKQAAYALSIFFASASADTVSFRFWSHWLHHYNHCRPHSSLGGRPPISRVHNVCGQDT